MSHYDDEMYKYLIQTENYLSAKQVVNLYSAINERLKNEFWNIIKRELNAKFLEYEKSSNWKFSENKRYFSISKWDGVYISYDFHEDNAIGITIEKSRFNRDEIYKLIEEQGEKLGKLDKENELWPCWKGFKNELKDENLEIILPDKRNKQIKKVITDILEYIVFAEPICEQISRLKLKS